MFHPLKLLSCAALILSLSACASLAPSTKVPAEIRYAPVIDIPYSVVRENIRENIGVNVRWGGEIIDSNEVGDSIELTVLAHPLSREGRPIPWSDKEFGNGRFIVAVKQHKETLIRKYLTVYGQVAGERELVNGPKSLTVPIITATESKEWNPEVALDKRGNAYYLLAHQPQKIHTFGRFERRGSFGNFGHRGFSKFGRGFRGHGFYSGGHFGKRGVFTRGRFH